MNGWKRYGVMLLALLLIVAGCKKQPVPETTATAALPPEPMVNHADMSTPETTIQHGEQIMAPNDVTQKLNAQHHPYKVLETRRVPGPWQPAAMKETRDFALSKTDLDVIHPGPGEFVHVMEGQRHGYQNLTIGITYTAPGGAPPMHTHKGEEAHVLLKGQKILYALGDKI